MTVASAVGYIALLNEPNAQVQQRALHHLLAMVDTNWHEMVDSLPNLTDIMSSSVHEGGHEEQRQAAALLCSRLSFHVGDMDKAVEYALLAGQLFAQLVDTPSSDGDSSGRSDYVTVIMAKAVDKYISAKQANTASIDVKLESMVEGLVKRCLDNGDYLQAIGIGLECRRLDILEAAVKAPLVDDERLGLVYYIVDVSVKMPTAFQRQLLQFCVSILQQSASPDHVTIADCLILLGDTDSVVQLLQQLITDTHLSIAMQICFNINDNASQSVKQTVMEALKGAPVFMEAVSGETANRLRLHFLSKGNATDPLIMERTKTMFSPNNSMFHSATCLANALMHAGTTDDSFIRKNMEWLSCATNWTKYTAVSSLGAIYRGHRQASRQLLSQYLPKDGVLGSEYAEAGALTALGFIHAGYPQDQWVLKTILPFCQQGRTQVIKHGACIGVGAAGFATKNQEAVNECRSVLFEDDAVSGEAAATALGLLLFGSNDVQVVDELLSFSRDTKHDKIKRSIGVAVAMIMYASTVACLDTVDQLLASQDGWSRFCGAWMVSLGFIGTGDRRALSRLLRLAVTDSNGDVRRVAVIGQSFVLLTRHNSDNDELTEMTRLMLDSYNPNLRFGGLMALGVGFAGTGNVQCLDMIDALMRTDKVDYVRQAAMMAAALVLVQQPADRQAPLRAHLERVIQTKHEEALTKFGAVLAQGILDCGGRNQTVSLTSPSGQPRPLAIAGMVMFCQSWFWYANATFLSLACQPTGLIAVTCTAQVPEMTVACHGRPSMFAYPRAVKGDKDVAPVQLVTAVLSTAQTGTGTEKEKESAVQVSQEAQEPEKKVPENADDIETDCFAVSNVSRVIAEQAKVIRFDGRFKPVSRFHPRSITVVIDSNPGEPCQYIDIDADDGADDGADGGKGVAE